MAISGGVPAHSQEKISTNSGTEVFSAARVADQRREIELELGPYLTLTFPSGTFSSTTAVSAQLDVAERRLNITTRGPSVTRTPTQINASLPDLEGGLNIVYDHQTDRGSSFEGPLIERVESPSAQIVALTDSGLEPVILLNNTSIYLTENDRRRRRIQWTELAYGDRVKVRFGNGRRATSIEATRLLGEGVLNLVTKDRLRLEGMSDQLMVNRHTRYEESDGTEFAFAGLRPNDRIELRLDPKTRQVWYVKRLSATTTEKPQLQVTHDGGRQLLPGDRVRITATGTPGGRLTIDIVNVESNLRAEELIGDPGTYVLVYTIPRGIDLDDTPIVARLDLPNRPSQTVLADAPLVFTAAGAAAADDGWEDVDQDKPKAPVITSPEEGSKVGRTIKVTGTASPRQKVRIVIDYAVTRSIVLLGEGRLVETVVTANSRGVFTTKEIPTEVQSLFGGDTDFRIAVFAVSASGEQSDPAMVHVRRAD